MPLPTTCHGSPWALVRRNGDTLGKRPSTRMAYLVGTVVPRGQHQAVAVTGFIMNNDMTNWTKHPRRIQWKEIIKTWRLRPTTAQIKAVKNRMPIVRAPASARAAAT